jgi:hypothetical protein
MRGTLVKTARPASRAASITPELFSPTSWVGCVSASGRPKLNGNWIARNRWFSPPASLAQASVFSSDRYDSWAGATRKAC